MTLALVALVVSGAHLAVQVAKYVASKTPSKKDDKVVAFIEANEDAVLAWVAKQLADKPAARKPGQPVDHRDK